MATDPNFVTGTSGLVVLDNTLNRVLFLDPQTFETVAVLDGFADSVHELAITPDRRHALCAIYGDGWHGHNPHPGHLIAVVDLATRQHVGDLDLSPHRGPHGLRWGPDGSLYALCEASGVVLELDGSMGEHRAAIPVGSFNAHRMEVLPGAAKLYTENEEDASASVIDLAARRLVRTIATPHALAGIGVSPDGARVVLVDDVAPELLLVDPQADAIAGTVRLEGHRSGAQIARFSPDGRWCVVTSLAAPIATILTADLSEQRLMRVGADPLDLAFHPDGRTALVANNGEGTLSVIDLPSGTVTRTVPVDGGPETLSFF